MVLPWHNPVLLAEQAATIDLLSGGRLEFGVGKGYRHNEFAGFCIPMEEADERFEESLALIIKSWTDDERFSHHGKYWNFENIIVEPPTKQKPHPPIWMAAGNPDSIRKVARRGSKLLLDQFASTAARDRALQHLQGRGRGLRAAHSIRWMSASAAPSMWPRTPRTRRKAIEARLANQPRLAKLAQTPDGNSKSSMLSFDQTLDAAAESAMFGTPDEIAEKLSRLRAAGVEHMLLTGPAGSRENLRALCPRRHAGVRRVGPGTTAPAAAREFVVHKPVPRAFGGIPPLIKRNTVLFALSQSFVGAGTQLAYGIGPLMVIARHRLGEPRRPHRRLVRHQPVPGVLSGRQDHRHLRPQARHPVRPGPGARSARSSPAWRCSQGSAIGLTLGMIIFTSGISAGQQLRVAATDMYLPRQRGLALGFVAIGLAGRHCAEPAA